MASAPQAAASGYETTCQRNNGQVCILDRLDGYSYSYSTMITVPSAINFICAGGYKSDGSLKDGYQCSDWNQRRYALAIFQAPQIQSYPFGSWHGGGAVNTIYVCGDLN